MKGKRNKGTNCQFQFEKTISKGNFLPLFNRTHWDCLIRESEFFSTILSCCVYLQSLITKPFFLFC